MENCPDSIETRLARAVYDVFKRADPTAYIELRAENGSTAIDGSFDLDVVARLILWDLRDCELLPVSVPKPPEPPHKTNV
jgi:hypothetical protein